MHLSTPVKTLLILAFVAVVALGGVVGVAFARDHATYDIVPPNTYVDGVDISGMTEQQAIEAIDSHLTTQAQTVSVRLLDETSGATYDIALENSLSYDVAGAVEAAISANQTRPASARFINLVRNDTPARNDITMGYQVDTTQVRTLVDALAQTIDTAPADAYRDFNDDDTVTLHEEVWGHATDVDATTNAVASALSQAVSTGASASELTAQPLDVTMSVSTTAPAVTVADLPPCIIVNYDTTMLYVFGTDPVNPIFSCGIGYGRGWEDGVLYNSPDGLHYIEYKDAAPTWTNPDPSGWGSTYPAVVGPGPDNPLGLRALKVSDAPMIFIHGVNDYGLIHHNQSHGCINVYNDDVVQLFDLIPEPSSVSTPIYVYFHGTQRDYAA